MGTLFEAVSENHVVGAVRDSVETVVGKEVFVEGILAGKGGVAHLAGACDVG